MKNPLNRLPVLLMLTLLAGFALSTSCGGGTLTYELHSSEEVVISNIKLVRLDGTELTLSDRPIPLMIHIKYAFSGVMEHAIFEESVSLVDEQGTAVNGSYEWAADDLSVIFVPSRRFQYRSTYTITINPSLLTSLSTDKALEYLSLTFVTMTEGDVNGDGYADYVISAPGYDQGDSWGQAYFFLGSPDGFRSCNMSEPTCIPDAIITGENIMWYGMGASHSVAGDVNSDGYSDLLIGASRANDTRGGAYLFYGSSDGIDDCDFEAGCSPDTTLAGPSVDSYFGQSLAIAGDVNGDGSDDIVVGAYLTGSVYVFLGSEAGMENCDLSAGCTPHATLTGEYDNNLLGYSVSSAGDVNGDGYDDIIVGDFDYPDAVGKGRSYIFLGSENGIGSCDLTSCTASTTITGKGDHNLFGYVVSSAGDTNGDGYDDILVAAPRFGAVPWQGQTYLFLGSETGIADCDLSAPSTCAPDATITARKAAESMGFADGIAAAGDVNADGYDDIAVGSAWFDAGSGKGQAYVFLGSADGIVDCDLTPPSTCTPDAMITGENDDDFFGRVMVSAGDVNGDGYDDLMIGANGYPAAGYGNGRGRAYCFTGSANGISSCDLPTCADAIITGASDGDWLGTLK